MKAARDIIRGRDEKVELGEIAHRLTRRELIEQLFGIRARLANMHLRCRASMRLFKDFSIGQQMFLIVGDGIDHTGDGTGIDGRTPGEHI